jgi:hypothetical protein
LDFMHAWLASLFFLPPLFADSDNDFFWEAC